MGAMVTMTCKLNKPRSIPSRSNEVAVAKDPIQLGVLPTPTPPWTWASNGELQSSRNPSPAERVTYGRRAPSRWRGRARAPWCWRWRAVRRRCCRPWRRTSCRYRSAAAPPCPSCGTWNALLWSGRLVSDFEREVMCTTCIFLKR